MSVVRVCDKGADIFNTAASCIVIPINTVGVMGAGLALWCARKFPNVEQHYKVLHDLRELEIGKVPIIANDPYQAITLFPTKRHWMNPSRLEWIVVGLEDLFKRLETASHQSVAIPVLGCGLGGLKWAAVKQAIEHASADYPKIRVELYPPH